MIQLIQFHSTMTEINFKNQLNVSDKNVKKVWRLGSYGAINLRHVPLRLRDQFRALCALRGTSMTRLLIKLIEIEVIQAIETGEYQPSSKKSLEEEIIETGQGQLWPKTEEQD